jgi:hypothetical protein
MVSICEEPDYDGRLDLFGHIKKGLVQEVLLFYSKNGSKRPKRLASADLLCYLSPNDFFICVL